MRLSTHSLLASLLGPAVGSGTEPGPAARTPRRVTLCLCGDVMTARGIDQILPHPGDPTLHEPVARSALEYVTLAERANGRIERPVDFAYPWGDALAAARRGRPDAWIANLETAVTRRGAPATTKGIHYRMHPGNVGCLTAAPVDCWTLANNHVLDWGRVGLEDTLDVLDGSGLRSAGAGRDRARAEAPAAVALPGDGRVLVFARGSVTSGIPWSWAADRDEPGVSLLEPAPVDRIAARVAAARRPGDLVVASIHWGGNWGYAIPAPEREIAHALVDDAGVDVVHGHSSHHPKAIEVYRGKPIFYGCGDFLNDYEGIGGHATYRAELTLLYFATFEPASASLVRLDMSPFRLARLRLNDASPDETRWLCETLDRQCRPLGTRVEVGDDGRLALRF